MIITRIITESKSKPKILFLQYNHPIRYEGYTDRKNFFRGYTSFKPLYKELINETCNADVTFCNYADIESYNNDYFVNDIKLSDFNFIFFGFMKKYPEAKRYVQYATKHKIPLLKYETYGETFDKIYQMELINELGLPYIESFKSNDLSESDLKKVKDIGYPIIVKEPKIDRGQGVRKFDDEESLVEFCESYFNSNSGEYLLFQKYIKNHGEYRIFVLRNKALLVSKATPVTKFDPSIDNRKYTKSTISQEVLSLCEEMSKHLNQDFVGFDVVIDDDTKDYYILETNASPNYAIFCITNDINIPQIVTDIICNDAIENLKRKN